MRRHEWRWLIRLGLRRFNIVNDFTPEEEEQIKKENEVSRLAPLDYLVAGESADRNAMGCSFAFDSGPRIA